MSHSKDEQYIEPAHFESDGRSGNYDVPRFEGDPPPESAGWGIVFGIAMGLALWGLLALGMWRMGWY